VRSWRATVPLLGAALLLGGCADYDPSQQFASAEARATTDLAGVPAPGDAQRVEVVRVVDGDTLVVTGEPGPVLPDGGEVRVRLLLVDTPEVDGPNAEEECLGPEASAFAEDLLPAGSELLLAPDEELLDQFDRTLVYAWTPDGTFVNELVVASGFGYSVFFPPNDEHLDVVLDAEDRARTARLGVWGSC
jgi:micrococcal nuclease